jgi:uncharacterized protein with HEPN domain
MTKKDFSVFVEHIFDSAKNIEDYVEKITEADFNSDVKSQDAVMKRFEIIGEATKRIPSDFRKKHSEIDWKKLADTRNFFVHEYFGVNKKRCGSRLNKKFQN